MKGQVLNQRYEVIMNLAGNHKQSVYLVRHLKLNTLWVIKKWDSKNNIKMQNEMNILTRINHPHIPRIVDCFETENDFFLVEEYFEGNTLEHIIQEKKGIDEKKALEWIIQIAKILNFLHQMENPIIYNDLKPSNMIAAPDESIKLIDFGSAREKGSETTFLSGTIGYAAPELYKGGPIDRATDIFSLGKVMYYMLTGFMHDLPMVDNSLLLSKKMIAIIEKSTRKNPQLRYQNMKELLRDIND